MKNLPQTAGFFLAETMFFPVGPGNEHRCYWLIFYH